jgi:hypothetical protein
MRRRDEWRGISSGNVWKDQHGGSTIRLSIKSHVIIVFYGDIRRFDAIKNISVCRTEFSISYTTYPIL